MYCLNKLWLILLSLCLTACSQIAINHGKSVPLSIAGINQNMPNCEYSAEAAKVGIYHFQFPEASSNDLVQVQGYKVHKIMSKALQQMIIDARSQGVQLKIVSAFRSIKAQHNIIQRKQNKGLAAKQIYFFSAASGFSEHHTGLAIDFYPINSGFSGSNTYQWLVENAGKYGFVQTFTEINSKITGISVEPWHWKYVGDEQAKALLANAECYRLPKSQWQRQ
ncbi:MAG: M15 family metallopeptidase [Lonepinella koalarum]|nr:M15 family metallopeptidase [Lonepinella koalarum]